MRSKTNKDVFLLNYSSVSLYCYHDIVQTMRKYIVKYLSLDDADGRSLEMCGGDPVISCNAGSGYGEQEVPHGSHMCPETCLYTAEKHRGSEFASS